MDIDLRLPSGEGDREDGEASGVDNLLDEEVKLHNGGAENGTLVDVGNELHAEDGGQLTYDTPVECNEDARLEPLSGMEFESYGEAYSFYQEYARSMGFNTAIQNSRRSKTSREFIDAKFACSRYGTKREYDKPIDRPRARKIKQEPDITNGRRVCSKTDCKASMHVKRRADGKWVIHKFVKEHNHELSINQAISEQTRRVYAAMARQVAEYKVLSGVKSESKSPFDKNQNSAHEARDVKLLLEFFAHLQNVNSNFFYAVDLGEDQRLKNLFWVDAKSRHDYIHFCDVASFDMTYVRNKYKMPLALFVGVNQHYRFVLLGCAFLSDESPATFTWLIRTWLKAMGGNAPKVIITDQDRAMKSVIAEVLPDTRHSFCLWHILGKLSENLGHIIKQNENFMAKFEKCIYRSWTEEEFENRWQKLVNRFELKEDEWFQSLHEDRKYWVPTFMKGSFLAGMSTAQRSDSVNSFFDKYVHKKTTVLEFVKIYEDILKDRYEEEAKADSDTWNKQPALKSPSPLEKHVSGLYTNAVFKKFQAEVLGVVACHPRRERQDETTITYRVQEVEKNENFIVTWNELKSEVSCMCRSFEYKGFLCRHALIVLQISALSHIPSHNILKRWTKDAKRRPLVSESSEQMLSRVQRYNDLCQRAMKLGEEGSLSQESYEIAFHSLEEALGNCASVNNSSKSLVDAAVSVSHGLLCIEEDSQSRSLNKTHKKKNPTKKRKVASDAEVMASGVQENLQQMDKVSSRAVNLDWNYNAPTVQGMVQLNLMAPTHNNFNAYQQTIPRLGQLNSLPSDHDTFYAPGMPCVEQMNFFGPSTSFYGVREDPNIRPAHLPEDASRHPQ